MSDQKREPESIQYDREASPTKKIAITPSTTSASTKSPSSYGGSASQCDKSPSDRIPITLKTSTWVQLSFEQAKVEGREYISKTHSMSEKERKALKDDWIARSKMVPIITQFLDLC
jgi:hypothetical protein